MFDGEDKMKAPREQAGGRRTPRWPVAFGTGMSTFPAEPVEFLPIGDPMTRTYRYEHFRPTQSNSVPPARPPSIAPAEEPSPRGLHYGHRFEHTESVARARERDRSTARLPQAPVRRSEFPIGALPYDTEQAGPLPSEGLSAAVGHLLLAGRELRAAAASLWKLLPALREVLEGGVRGAGENLRLPRV